MIVRKLRLQRGWSQDQLAELTGLNVRTIQRIERGQKPSLESAKSLASVFEVDLSTFTVEDTAMNANEKVDINTDEQEAIQYGKRMMEFYQGLLAYIICAVVFFAVFGFGNPILYWVFLGVGAGLIVQGLFAYEVFRFSPPNWEKKIVERKLGRKL